MLGLGYPGGPAVEQAAAGGDVARFRFPRPLLDDPGGRYRDSLDFSFSGLKTAVRLAAQKVSPLSEQDVQDICAGFQASVTEILARRCRQALQRFRTETGRENPDLVIAGGVAANRAIFSAMEMVAEEQGARMIVPSPSLCTDNGAMVAWAGAERHALGQSDGFDLAARARWPLESDDMKVRS
ncbi:MAG TPA: tRNA (adenosine(37)-N6)-threonylcarbamoyltransferase complex transferase subunit TsaD, partial [Devosia sp.]|nr:tRNA (adenosine(37)-N6)-threonylcarbamoyltransferase complex transferase subunit TsaD [Devosia sp.]